MDIIIHFFSQPVYGVLVSVVVLTSVIEHLRPELKREALRIRSESQRPACGSRI